MTLDSTEKVYQSDLMHITPMADAMIYGYGGDWILAGLGYEITASGIEIQPGRAIIQGHLYTLNSTKIIPLNVGTSGFVGWSIDLTQDNSATGSDVTNNQYTFGFFTGMPGGNTLEGDTSATIGLYQITASGTSWDATELMFPYYDRQTINAPFPGTELSSGTNGGITITRKGNQMDMEGEIRSIGTWNGDTKIIFGENVVRPSLRPSTNHWLTAQLTNGMATRITFYTSGRLSLFYGMGRSGSSAVDMYTSSHPYTYGNIYLSQRLVKM